MDNISEVHYDETPRQRFVKNAALIIIVLFVLTVTILALVDGFSESGLEAHALLGICLFMFAVTTLAMFRKITAGDMADSAKIPIYIQMVLLIFLGTSILINDYSNWHPSELNCYYDDKQQFVRQQGHQCWIPPTCFQGTSSCMLYLSPDTYQCATWSRLVNATMNRYSCIYNAPLLPTPRPTPQPTQPTPNMDRFTLSAPLLPSKHQRRHSHQPLPQPQHTHTHTHTHSNADTNPDQDQNQDQNQPRLQKNDNVIDNADTDTDTDTDTEQGQQYKSQSDEEQQQTVETYDETEDETEVETEVEIEENEFVYDEYNYIENGENAEEEQEQKLKQILLMNNNYQQQTSADATTDQETV